MQKSVEILTFNRKVKKQYCFTGKTGTGERIMPVFLLRKTSITK